jgi:DNA replication licensing factor MCM6
MVHGTDKYYISMVHGMRIDNLSTLYVDYRHLAGVQGGVLATEIANQYYRYIPYLTRALHNVISRYEPRYFREHRQPGSTEPSTNGANASGSANSDRTPNQQTDKLFTVACLASGKCERKR